PAVELQRLAGQAFRDRWRAPDAAHALRPGCGARQVEAQATRRIPLPRWPLLLPLPLRGRQRLPNFAPLPFRLRQPAVEDLELRLLFLRGRGDVRRRVAVLDGAAELGHVVEVGEELVELLLRHGVILVVVAAGAAERQAQPYRGRCLDAIDYVFHLV